VAAGTHLLLITRPGYTPAMRVVVTTAGRGADVFDPRLTPAGSFASVTNAGGEVDGPHGLRLAVPPGALAATTDISVTALEEQGLPALLPYGWSPQGAAWITLRSGSLAAPATLALPVEAPNGVELALVKLDLGTLLWRFLGPATVANGAVEVPVASDGSYAALLADEGASAPPAPVTGSPLGSAPAPPVTAVTAATIAFAPAVVLPAQRSVATVGYTASEGVASGMPLTIRVREELTLLDGTVRREAPYEADLVLYHSFEHAPRSRFGLVPSSAAQTTPVSMGAEDVTVSPYEGGTLQGNVLGAAGGVVGTAEGDRVEVPAGALAEPTAVTLSRQSTASLPQPVPSGTELIGVLALDFGGRELALPAGLAFELGTAPSSGASGLLLELVEVGGSDLYRAVAALTPTSTGWATAPIDPADLPWPGVRHGGRFALVRLLQPVGFFRGRVFGASGSPLSGTVVRGSAAQWVAIAAEDGRYVLPSPLGSVSVTGEHFATGQTGAATAAIAQAGQRVDLDLQLGRIGPQVVATTPADGATNVIAGIQPTVRFSKPVDTASLAGGIRLLEEGEREVAITFARQGDLVTVTPRATLRPGTAFELRIGNGVRDLSGTQLASPVVVRFTTRQPVVSDGIDLARIHLVEPNASGQARILGRPGAVPHDAAVFAENTSRLASTVTVEAAADGSFELSVEAGLGDTVLLHVLLSGANEVVVALGPFMTADLRSAFVDAREARFTTGDGIAVVVPAGAFESAAVVTLTPRAPAQVAVTAPSAFNPVSGFDLSFGGVSASKPLQIAVPAPAGAAVGRYLLARVVDVLGERRWMMQDLMRLAAGAITTEEAPQGAAQAAALPVKAATTDAGAQVLAKEAAVRPKEYVPGAAVPGSYQVWYSPLGLSFIAMPFVAEFEAAIEIEPLGMVAVINREIQRL
ncbi:MAG TPA: Ig-like domain-containing protein, partial [Thermoanaerobaculia bacterium]|nr:Ig-like domain-containing protein [Thermoanaerobaculia bacterium]